MTAFGGVAKIRLRMDKVRAGVRGNKFRLNVLSSKCSRSNLISKFHVINCLN